MLARFGARGANIVTNCGVLMTSQKKRSCLAEQHVKLTLALPYLPTFS